MNTKIKKILGVGLFSLAFSVHAVLPVYPGEILGRDMDVPVFGFLGHVGIATAPYVYQDAYQVLEVLKDPQHVIQLNLITDFKSRSPYWGSRYGIADRGEGALRLLREGNFHRDLDCTDYTKLAGYEPSRGYYDYLGRPQCTSRGIFRCDTFVYYLFGVGGYNLPVSTAINPTRVFLSFPYGNGDGPSAPESIAHSNDSNEGINLGLDGYNDNDLSSMPIENFYHVVDISNEQIAQKNQDRLLALAKNTNLLSSSKRSMILDKLSFVGKINILPECINLFKEEKNNALKNQIITTAHHIFQHQCPKMITPECLLAKDKLLSFYKVLVQKQTELTPSNASLVVRGLINLSERNEIISDHEQINRFIDAKNVGLDARSKLTLKLNLMSVSRSFESIYLSEIISLLNFENNPDLAGTFNRYIVARLSRTMDSFTPEDKIKIELYLETLKNQHAHIGSHQNSLLQTQSPGMFDYGSWLEAYALIHANSHEEAAKNVADFIGALKTKKEQEQYVIGLSNTPYMQKAFIHEPVLNEFKKNNREIYRNTVGVQIKTQW